MHKFYSLFFAGLIFAMIPAAQADEPSEAFSFYLGYLETTSKAENLADITAFMPEWWRERYESASADDQAAAVARIRGANQRLQDVKLLQEVIVEGGVQLHMTATDNALPMRGKVLLIEESGAFKVEESSWASGQ